jgi:DNA adenine methylase
MFNSISSFDLNLKSPFPWFGGKARASAIVWERFGEVPNYAEPFAGSLAVLLKRPNYDPFKHTEAVNDLDCMISNFWRALQHDPESVARFADSPVNECDLHAKHRWLINQADFREQMKTDPDYFDAKIAGWWVWGLSAWIGSGWCEGLSNKLPNLGNTGRGVHRQRPHLGDAGRGVHRQLPHLGDTGQGMTHSDLLYDYFDTLACRLKRVRVCCGDWTRVLGKSSTTKIGITGVLLDPPYEQKLRNSKLYRVETEVSEAVREWAIQNGNNPKLRIALCGYEDEHAMPDDWECVEWKAQGGFSGQKKTGVNDNRLKERIWFSPHCLKIEQRQQLSLFA